MSNFDLRLGDCLEILREMPDASVDAVVTDPPYGLSDHRLNDVEACLQAWLSGLEYRPQKRGFMGRSWDGWVPGPELWREVYRVMKPGAYLVVFASTRTDDLMSMACRLAGFRKHPAGVWVFGSGFPKATDLSKQFDKQAGAEREVVGEGPFAARRPRQMNYRETGCANIYGDDAYERPAGHAMTAPVTANAKRWSGWAYGLQALKSAFEPWLMFQKPPEGRMTDNVARFGTGALNIDGCRVPTIGEQPKGSGDRRGSTVYAQDSWTLAKMANGGNATPAAGRWPANLIHDGSDEVTGLFPANAKTGKGGGARMGFHGGDGEANADRGYGDTGSAARFFYCAKASRRDRDEGLGAESQRPAGVGDERKSGSNQERRGKTAVQPRSNHHPTVKPTDLMRYLCRLVTPPGGVILDPFMGSGSTGKAAMHERFCFVGIERDEEYMQIAKARVEQAKLRNGQDIFAETVSAQR